MDKPKPITESQLRLLKPLMRWFTRLNVLVYKCSGGRVMSRFGGGDVCPVRMTGAKSGVKKEIPLMVVPYQASDTDKAEVWALCCEHYNNFDLYQRRISRNIPVFICEPDNA